MLQGKRAIITGSSVGIGRAIADELARLGASVVINARNAAAVQTAVDEIGAAGGTAVGCPGAIDDEAVAHKLVETCVEIFGGVDIVVNNAAIFGPDTIGPIGDCPSESWRQTFDVNVHGPFYLAKAALPHLIAQRWGRIINASSFAGTGKIGGSAYSVSKAALYGMTRSMAADYGPYGITVNAYNPEALTAMGEGHDPEAYNGFLKYLENKGFREPIDTAYSTNTGSAAAIAPLIAYLSLDEADFLNGEVITVESRRIGLINAPDEDRVLYRSTSAPGDWSLDEIREMAPYALRARNQWPRREGAALEAWMGGQPFG